MSVCFPPFSFQTVNQIICKSLAFWKPGIFCMQVKKIHPKSATWQVGILVLVKCHEGAACRGAYRGGGMQLPLNAAMHCWAALSCILEKCWVGWKWLFWVEKARNPHVRGGSTACSELSFWTGAGPGYRLQPSTGDPATKGKTLWVITIAQLFRHYK